MSLTRLPVKMLGDMVSPRALERIFQDAAIARGTTVEALDVPTLEDILKKEVFKRLQLSVPAPLAKKRVSEVLAELMKSTQERMFAGPDAASIATLEESARRFALYFDWPEAQRLRGILGVVRDEEKAGRDVRPLTQEGFSLIGLMERRLEEGLVAQAQDLAELRATFTRVEGLGNRDVRRLETLITQIDEAQGQGTLLPAEVERARDLTFKLRKLLESSVVQPLGGLSPDLDPEVQARVQALEQEHTGKVFSGLEREFAPLLRAREDLEAQRQAFARQQQAGKLSSEALDAWRADLTARRAEVVEGQRQEYLRLEEQLNALQGGADVRVLLDSARMALDSGAMISDELDELRRTVGVLQAAQGAAGELLSLNRDLMALERDARGVPGASEELAPLLADALAAVGRGERIDPAPLWEILERHMGAAAQQRENFDVRAEHVIREYDAVRGLAGETTQRLGRLADTLRAQRRLGAMSAEARERYVQTIVDAEALLAEAQAEHRAAQEVTSTFGQDALSGLLDVFDLGGGDGSGGGLFGALDDAPAAAPAGPQADALADDSLESWVVEGGQVVDGSDDPTARRVVDLLGAAQALGLTRVDLGGPQGEWAAHSDGQGGWRVARAATRGPLDRVARPWLETGEV
ncbi:hypothetical protein [Deinococcus ficus]|uniref:hypothetical protein n=1 Tax=Deinococcus ficus TaxID=317577 RepID=UPI0003B5B91C|nr:hypothetical protein [Deinococcus ficus]